MNKLNVRSLLLAAAFAATTNAAAAPIAVVDGTLSGLDSYQASFSLGLELDQLCHDKKGDCGAASDFTPGDDSDKFDADLTSFTGELRLGWADDGDLFLAFVLPTEVQDMTYGDNASSGYRDPDQGAFDKLTGSEYFSFVYGGNEIKVGMDDSASATSPIVDAATSLDWNAALFPDLTQKGASSPVCGTSAIQNAALGDGTGGTVTWQQKDADCYANPAAGYELWEFQHIYELRIDGGAFADISRDLDGLYNISSIIGSISVHASDPKRGGGHGFTIDCLSGPTISCTPIDPPVDPPVDPPSPVTEPAAPLMLITGFLVALVARRRLRA